MKTRMHNFLKTVLKQEIIGTHRDMHTIIGHFIRDSLEDYNNCDTKILQKHEKSRERETNKTDCQDYHIFKNQNKLRFTTYKFRE